MIFLLKTPLFRTSLKSKLIITNPPDHRSCPISLKSFFLFQIENVYSIDFLKFSIILACLTAREKLIYKIE